MTTKTLWAVELDISFEAGKKDTWVIYDEIGDDGTGPKLCVYETRREALVVAGQRDHDARVVKFIRAGSSKKCLKLKKTKRSKKS
jgi:hypothetical protein